MSVAASPVADWRRTPMAGVRAGGGEDCQRRKTAPTDCFKADR